ncbi:hypothetical protein RhiLY_10079 [Ceratobasidium sp. AG-Ba]|nr:hypothetical protein RhiLY_10079 [Ceratobasidium sp. AG-Ba]
MASTSSLTSSPIKRSGPSLESLSATEARNDSRYRNLVSEIASDVFEQIYLLRTSPPLPEEWPENQAPLLPLIKNIQSGSETQLYQHSAPLLSLLNSISLQVHNSRGEPHESALVFRSCSNHCLTSPYLGAPQKPDLIARWESLSVLEQAVESSSNLTSLKPPSWFDLAIVGEAKVDRTDPAQVGNYVRHFLRHRPELNAVLGFFANKKGYRLVYHDASVVHLSAPFSWSSRPLYAFVHRIYDKPFQDPSMRIIGAHSDHATWATNVAGEVFIAQKSRPEPGLGQRRYTSLGIHLLTARLLFIKDVWWHALRRYHEGLMYERAHAGAPISGLMTVGHYGYVLDKFGQRIRTMGGNLQDRQQKHERYKMRITTSDIGRRLEDVETLSELLSVIYDACAVQRNLYRKCKILHRDISDGNIMLAPNSEQYRERCANGYAEVKFVNQVISGNKDEKPNPTCLLIDLGNGADLNTLPPREALAERTGTPKFIARSLSGGKCLDFRDYSSTSVTMPVLTDRALDLHRIAYGSTYDDYNQEINQDSTVERNAELVHQLFHDAESTFWVTAWILARSAGENYQPEDTWSQEFRTFVNGMRDHHPDPDTLDVRISVGSSEEYWRSILHSDLAGLTLMLSEMFYYIRPEWSYRTQLDAEHVHEAMMRLLLTEIVRLVDDRADIPLAVGVRALPPIQSSSHRSQKNTSLSADQPTSRSRTRTHNSLEPPSSISEETSEPDTMRVGKKRKSPHLNGRPARRPSPRSSSRLSDGTSTRTETETGNNPVQRLKDEVQGIQWGSLYSLQKPVNGEILTTDGQTS